MNVDYAFSTEEYLRVRLDIMLCMLLHLLGGGSDAFQSFSKKQRTIGPLTRVRK